MTGIGAPRPRVDGPAKVRGAAPFLADLPNDGGLEGRFVVSGVAAGRVEAVELDRARGLPGVVAAFGPGELPALPALANWTLGQERQPLQRLDVAYAGQPVALVLAETAVEAERAAAAVSVRIAAEPPRLGLAAHLDLAEEIDDWAPTRTATGDVDAALAGAAVVVRGRYRTANRHHAAMEPAGALARWTGDDLELWTSTQWVGGVREALSKLLDVPLERVRVRAAHVGGGFGAKGSCWPHEIFAALAARVVGRPVRIVLPREQSFAAHGYQPETAQDVTLAAERDGRLTAIRHHSVSAAAMHDDYVEHGSLGSRSMYACPSIETLDRVVRLHQPQPTFMRAPHEGPGMVALEIAMDELAERLGLDPLELRLRNYAERDPTSGKPFSSKALRRCYEIGAERFGWARRPAAPRSMRDGEELVGLGMASALMATFRFGSSARVTLERTGQVRVETASHDIGTGVATILSQIAADTLGVDPDRISVRLADTALPEAGGTFGSATTIGVGSAVQAAAVKLRQRLEELAGEPDLQPHEYGEVLALRQLETVAETASWAPRKEDGASAMNAYGAVFAEVRIDPDLPVPRVSRVVGVYSAGRIVNPRTARSQLIGGVTWGIGQALLEASPVDPVTGRFVPAGFGGYRIPSNADVPALDLSFAEEHDPIASPLGARGVGEIGTIGIGAAIANAVYHATGVRVRELPIRVEQLL